MVESEPKLQLSAYEQEALAAIHAWKDPRQGWFGHVVAATHRPFYLAGDAVMSMPGVGWALDKSIGGLVSLLNDLAQFSVRPEAIHEEFRKGGYPHVQGACDVRALDLCSVDRVIGALRAKYKAAAAMQGTATGMIGAAALPADVLALTALNLRAIGEYATYCGFDLRLQQERLFAMHILGAVSSPSAGAKSVAMAQLVRIAREVAEQRAWHELEVHAFATVLKGVAKALGLRLTKAKLAQLVPTVGAVVGGGFNAYFTDKVCDAAYFLYRERFLARKYGASVIEQTVHPADDFTSRYPEHTVELPRDTTPPPP